MSANEELGLDRQAALASLTPEERAAIEDDEDDAAQASAATDNPDDDEDEGGDGDEGDEGVIETLVPAKPIADTATPEAAVEIAGDATVTPTKDEPVGEFRPRYSIALPEDFDAQLKAIDDATAALATKFKEGDISAEEFITENNEISKKKSALDNIRTKAELAAELNQQAGTQEWEWTLNRFFRQTKKAEGIDYAKDAEKNADFDFFIKALAAKPENNDKDYDWFLNEAHRRTKTLHGIVDTKKVDGVPTDKKAEKPSRKPPTSNLPATLAQVPGGDGPGDVADEFSDIHKLDGLEYETALARMSPDQRERYLQAA